MKKKKKTYGVSGMMEYQAVIKIGRSTMKVLFTDGSMNAMGMNPATYTTENLMVQNAIENSDQFKRGRIKVVSVIDLDEEVQIMHNAVKEVKEVKADEEVEAPDGTDQSIVSDKSEQPEESGEETTEAEVGNPSMTEMEFDNNDDAKDYLEQTFGCVRSKLRNREDIKAAGEANGVKIIFV